MSANTVSARRLTRRRLRIPAVGFGSQHMLAAAGRTLLSPVMRAWYLSGLSANDFVPRPRGRTAHACGPRPARILILGGGGAAIGWGVCSQDLALPGHLARALASATGRGIDVSVVAHPELALTDAPAALTGQDLAIDAAVVVTGVREAVTLRSPGAWRRDVTALIRRLQDDCLPSTAVLIAGIQPIRCIPVFRTPVLADLAARHADRLNALTREVCEGKSGVTFTALPAPTDPCEGRYRSPANYRQWAATIALGLREGVDHAGGSIGVSRWHAAGGTTGDGDRLCESDRCPRSTKGRTGPSSSASVTGLSA
jgi:hypothetical protein